MEQDTFVSRPRFGRGDLAALLAVACAIAGWGAFVAYLVIVDRHTPAVGITLSCGSTLERVVGILAAATWLAGSAGIVMGVTAFIRRTNFKTKAGLALVACLILVPIALVFFSAGYGCDAPI